MHVNNFCNNNSHNLDQSAKSLTNAAFLILILPLLVIAIPCLASHAQCFDHLLVDSHQHFRTINLGFQPQVSAYLQVAQSTQSSNHIEHPLVHRRGRLAVAYPGGVCNLLFAPSSRRSWSDPPAHDLAQSLFFMVMEPVSMAARI